MTFDNRPTRWLIVALLVLLVIPLLVATAMMVAGTGMMAQMGGMMGAGAMALCVLWAVLVAAVLVTLITLLIRGTAARATTRETSSRLAH